MINIPCNLCGADDYTILFKSGIAQINQIVKCNHCSLMYANPRMHDVSQEVFIKEFDPAWVLAHGQRRFEKESLQIRDYKKTQAYINKNYPNQGKLIEIGSGFGHLLNFFKQDGWDVMGIEPLKGGCLFSESEFGIKAIPKTLEEASLNENSVDVVLMMHVIEHVSDPSSTFKEVYRILKPGGIFILETPRYDTFMFKMFAKRERSLSCNGHIYFFTTHTLKKMATNAALTVQKIDYVGRSLTLDRMIWNIGVISKSATIKRSLKWISAKLRFNKIWFYLNMKDMQRMYLKK